jgi:N-acetyl-alpha-D-glucosaminyl L-malate synthase BshA
VEDVIAIFAAARKQRRAKLLMVGDGPDRPKAEWLAGTHGVAQDVLFLGKQNEMAPFLSVADILLLPSQDGSFGLVALEAMASEVPVIASRVGGLPEVVEDEEDGFLREPGGVEAMAECASRILADKVLRERMGKAARAHALRDFCATKIVTQYENLYEATRRAI